MGIRHGPPTLSVRVIGTWNIFTLPLQPPWSCFRLRRDGTKMAGESWNGPACEWWVSWSLCEASNEDSLNKSQQCELTLKRGLWMAGHQCE